MQASYLNVADVKFSPENFLNAAMAGVGDGSNGGGPIWAIFDADAVKRGTVGSGASARGFCRGYFFAAPTYRWNWRCSITSKYQARPVPADALAATVSKYNSYVDAGKDADFGKPAPKYKIQTPPFHAAWATPVIHDTRSGLRINAKCQVVDLGGNVIAGLYCGGESAGGFSLHGLARCIVQGRIAAKNAAAES